MLRNQKNTHVIEKFAECIILVQVIVVNDLEMYRFRVFNGGMLIIEGRRWSCDGALHTARSAVSKLFLK